MTDVTHAALQIPREPAGPRRDAFRAAGRHTARVRLMRRLVLFGSVGGTIAVLYFAFFNPFRITVAGVSVSGIGLGDGKVTMEHPKLTGFKADGRPYELLADRAIQDVKKPNVLALEKIDAHVTMADKSVVHIVADNGLYDSSAETMRLTSPAHLTSDNGLDAHLQSAYVEFKTGTVDTPDPVTIVMNTGTISADSMHMVDNGRVATFVGHVHTTMTPAATAVTTASAMKKGSNP